MGYFLKVIVSTVFIAGIWGSAPARAISPCILLDGIASRICSVGYGQVKKQIKTDNFLKKGRSQSRQDWHRVPPTASQRRKFGNNVQCFKRETHSEYTVKCRRKGSTNVNRG